MYAGFVHGHIPWSAGQSSNGHFNHVYVGQYYHLASRTMLLNQDSKVEILCCFARKDAPTPVLCPAVLSEMMAHSYMPTWLSLVCAKHRTEKPMSLFTYLTVQVPRKDTFLQDELRKCQASLPANWGKKPNVLQDDRSWMCSKFEFSSRLWLIVLKLWTSFSLRDKSKTNDLRN